MEALGYVGKMPQGVGGALLGSAGMVASYGEHHVVVQQVALRVEHHHLTSCADAWVDTHHALLSEGSGQQQLSKVLLEDMDGLVVGLLLAERRKLVLDRRLYEPFVGVVDGLAHQCLASAIATHVLPAQAVGAILVVDGDADAQHALGLAAADGQEAVG